MLRVFLGATFPEAFPDTDLHGALELKSAAAPEVFREYAISRGVNKIASRNTQVRARTSDSLKRAARSSTKDSFA